MTLGVHMGCPQPALTRMSAMLTWIVAGCSAPERPVLAAGSVDGSDKSSVSRAIESGRTQLLSCVQDRDGSLTSYGTLVLAWRLNAAGQVEEVATVESDVSEEASRCVARISRTWAFAAGSAREVRHRLTLPTDFQIAPDRRRSVIHKNIGDIQECYERELGQGVNMTGQVLLRWLVGSDGSVTSVSVEADTLPRRRTSECMVERIRTWRFPKPHGGPAQVVFPFWFKGSSESQ